MAPRRRLQFSVREAGEEEEGAEVDADGNETLVVVPGEEGEDEGEERKQVLGQERQHAQYTTQQTSHRTPLTA